MKEIEFKGLERFSLRAVGSAAGLSSMAVYRHFKNKQELLRAVGEEAFGAFNSRALAIPSGSVRGWFRKLTRSYVEFYLDSPGRFEACFVFKTSVERIYPRDFRAGESPVISLMARRLEEAQSAGQLDDADALELALQLWAQVHGLVALHKAGRFLLPRAAFLALCERAVARQLGSAASRQRRAVPKKRRSAREY